MARPQDIFICSEADGFLFMSLLLRNICKYLPQAVRQSCRTQSLKSLKQVSLSRELVNGKPLEAEENVPLHLIQSIYTINKRE